MKSYERILEITGKMLKLQSEINKLKPKAVKELREIGYSYDMIISILHSGKVTAIKYEKQNKKALRGEKK